MFLRLFDGALVVSVGFQKPWVGRVVVVGLVGRLAAEVGCQEVGGQISQAEALGVVARLHRLSAML